MIFQFPNTLLSPILLIDLILIGLIFVSTIPKRKIFQRTIYILTTLVFLGFGLFKLLGTSPGSLASTPCDLEIKNDGHFTTVYYLREMNGEQTVFWKDHLLGEKIRHYFELESSISDSLVIARKINNEYKYQSVRFKWDSVSFVDFEHRNFEKDRSGKIAKAIKNYRMTEFGNYLTNLLTLGFILTLTWRMIKYGP